MDLEQVKAEVEKAATEKVLTCHDARALAEKLGVDYAAGRKGLQRGGHQGPHLRAGLLLEMTQEQSGTLFWRPYRSDVSLALLAGGRSTRMGEDKAFAPFNGKTLLEWMRDTLAPALPTRVRRHPRALTGSTTWACRSSTTPSPTPARRWASTRPSWPRPPSGSSAWPATCPSSPRAFCGSWRTGPRASTCSSPGTASTCSRSAPSTASARSTPTASSSPRAAGASSTSIPISTPAIWRWTTGATAIPSELFMNVNTPAELEAARQRLAAEEGGWRAALQPRIQAFMDASPLPVVSFIGKKKSGKTTVVLGVIKELRSRGYRVAAIKHDTHGFEIDVPGTDSYRFRELGAEVVGISSPWQVRVAGEHRGRAAAGRADPPDHASRWTWSSPRGSSGRTRPRSRSRAGRAAPSW